MQCKENKDMDTAELLRKHQEWIAARVEVRSTVEMNDSLSKEKLQEKAEFDKFVENNPEIVLKCKNQAEKLIPRMIKNALEIEYKSYKFREYLKSKYPTFDKG